MSDPFRIVFVCTGNSCRSPAAEAILKKALSDKGLAQGVEVSSTGISAYDGLSASEYTITACERYGATLEGFKSQPLTQEVCDQADLLLLMDYSHRDYLNEMYPSASDKAIMLGGFISDRPGQENIPDPVGSPQDVYDRVIELIRLAIDRVVENWEPIKRRYFETKKYIIAIGSDHRGFPCKERVKSYLEQNGYTIVDCGTHSTESCDHPLFAIRVAELVSLGRVDRGILACASGHGMIISANKVMGIRAAMPMNKEHAELSRTHNNANVLVIGGDYIEFDEQKAMIDVWLTTGFFGGKYQKRVNMISDYEQLKLC